MSAADSPSHVHQAPPAATVPFTTTSRIIIVGAGAFGLSTAFHLLSRGYTDLTILDRAKALPAVDAASTDINKVVRSCYGDMFYTKLAREAIQAWKQPMWQGCYHECGVINVGGGAFDEASRENDRLVGAPIEGLPDADAVRNKLLSFLDHPTHSSSAPVLSDSNSNARRVGLLPNYHGYFNREGGWTEAARAMEILFSHVKAMGARVMENSEVTDLVRNQDGRTTGVKCSDGRCFEADRVVLAVGSWTASAFPELELESRCLATGQSMATIQLGTEEKERYKHSCVFLDFDSGLYVLPPTDRGVIKLGVNTAGHTRTVGIPQHSGNGQVRLISTPRTVTNYPNSGDGLRIPRSALYALREKFGRLYPELAEMAWSGTRLCWYTDAPDGNWVIGPFPADPALFLATSGSGHGFKFLPNVGRLVVDALEGTLDPAIAARFAVDRNIEGAKKGERPSEETEELDEGELCGPEGALPAGKWGAV